MQGLPPGYESPYVSFVRDFDVFFGTCFGGSPSGELAGKPDAERLQWFYRQLAEYDLCLDRGESHGHSKANAISFIRRIVDADLFKTSIQNLKNFNTVRIIEIILSRTIIGALREPGFVPLLVCTLGLAPRGCRFGEAEEAVESDGRNTYLARELYFAVMGPTVCKSLLGENYDIFAENSLQRIEKIGPFIGAEGVYALLNCVMWQTIMDIFNNSFSSLGCMSSGGQRLRILSEILGRLEEGNATGARGSYFCMESSAVRLYNALAALGEQFKQIIEADDYSWFCNMRELEIRYETLKVNIYVEAIFLLYCTDRQARHFLGNKKLWPKAEVSPPAFSRLVGVINKRGRQIWLGLECYFRPCMREYLLATDTEHTTDRLTVVRNRSAFRWLIGAPDIDSGGERDYRWVCEEMGKISNANSRARACLNIISILVWLNEPREIVFFLEGVKDIALAPEVYALLRSNRSSMLYSLDIDVAKAVFSREVVELSDKNKDAFKRLLLDPRSFLRLLDRVCEDRYPDPDAFVNLFLQCDIQESMKTLGNVWLASGLQGKHRSVYERIFDCLLRIADGEFLDKLFHGKNEYRGIDVVLFDCFLKRVPPLIRESRAVAADADRTDAGQADVSQVGLFSSPGAKRAGASFEDTMFDYLSKAMTCVKLGGSNGKEPVIEFENVEIPERAMYEVLDSFSYSDDLRALRDRIEERCTALESPSLARPM